MQWLAMTTFVLYYYWCSVWMCRIIATCRAHIVLLPQDRVSTVLSISLSVAWPLNQLLQQLKSMGTKYQFILISSPPSKEAAFQQARARHGSVFAFQYALCWFQKCGPVIVFIFHSLVAQTLKIGIQSCGRGSLMLLGQSIRYENGSIILLGYDCHVVVIIL